MSDKMSYVDVIKHAFKASCYIMFMAFILLLTVLIAIFSNVLFYTVCLLAMSVTVLVWLVCSNYLRTLILLLVVVVYVGAMMILIGYICAVSPNFNLSPSYEFIPLVLFVLGYLYSSFYIFGFTLSDSKLRTLLDYFFRR